MGEAQGLSPADAAFGVTEMVDEQMANAARVHAVENGREIEDFTMIAFGGGAPLHAARLAEKLGIGAVLVPPGAGVGSAIGFLEAPVSYETARGLYQRLDTFDAGTVNAVLEAMEAEALRFVEAGAAGQATETRLVAHMRYSGQGWEIPVPLDTRVFGEDAPAKLRSAFEEAYRTLFGRIIEGLAIEVANWTLSVATPRPPREAVTRRETGRKADGQGAPVPRCRPARPRRRRRGGARRPLARRPRRWPGHRDRGRDLDHRHQRLHLHRAGRRQPSSDPEGPHMSIDAQIMWNRLIAVVEEQATTLVRTAFSTSVREAGDLSAGLFDARGRMMAQAVTGTPGHVNAMAESVGHFIDAIGRQTMKKGDVYITNDPWLGTGHLHDITVVTPVFREGRLIGFFACTAHIVDIGGRGFGPDANEVYEEGLLIPISRFADAGEVNAFLVDIVRANVREPVQVVGDIYSLAACNEAGEKRLQAMLDEFRTGDLEDLSDFIAKASHEATRAAIAKVPDGTYTHEMTVDGFEAPVEMHVKLTVAGDRITCDFAGTSGMSRFGVNCPEVYTRAYACYALKCAIAPEVPNNAASLEPFEITAPEGSILAARRPAPVSVRHVMGHLVPDVVLGALHKALPGTGAG